MNGSKLDEAGHAITESGEDEPVEGGGVVNFGQVGARVQRQRRQRQHRRDPFFMIQPRRNVYYRCHNASHFFAIASEIVGEVQTGRVGQGGKVAGGG